MMNNKKKPGMFKKRRCELCDSKITYVDYKDVKFLEKFVSGNGSIKPSASTGNCAKDQRKVTMAIKRARFIALMPYTKERVRNNK